MTNELLLKHGIKYDHSLMHRDLTPYYVRVGDTWTKIAQQHLGRTSGYEVIARMNGLEPERPLRVGGRILVPALLPHSLDRGETLGMLAERYYGDSRRSDLLRSYNQIDDPRRLSVGEKIEIPLILPLSETPQPDPPAAPEPAPPARRFEGQLRTARGAFHAGSFEDALETLAPLIQPIEHEGTSLDRTELWALLAFVYVAFDRNEEACTAYGLAVSASSQSPLDPVLVSPKIRKALANCR